jgi:hypothetical protein
MIVIECQDESDIGNDLAEKLLVKLIETGLTIRNDRNVD